MDSNLSNYFNFFTEIEEFFITKRGKHIVLSPLDWTLIETWRDMGVPLHVALRGIDRAVELFKAKRSKHRFVNTLYYCNQAVMEEYETFLLSMEGAGQAEAIAPDEAATPSSSEHAEIAFQEDALRCLQQLQSEVSSLPQRFNLSAAAVENCTRVKQHLASLAEELARVVSPDFQRLDQDLHYLADLLLPALEESLPTERLKELRQQCRAELRHYRQNLPDEMYRKILDNFFRKKILEQFQLSDFTMVRL